MSNNIANPDAIGYKADAGETTTPQTAPRARAKFKLPTWKECCAIPTEKRSALQHFIFFYEYDDGDGAEPWRDALAGVLAQHTWQPRDSYRGTPGTRVWFWWHREGVPPTMDDAWIDGHGRIAAKGDGWGHRYSHVMPVEPPVTGPSNE